MSEKSESAKHYVSSQLIKFCSTTFLGCPRLPIPTDGHLIYFNERNQQIDPNAAAIFPGTTAKLTCSHGKRLRGAGESICHSSEKWLPYIGTCI